MASSVLPLPLLPTDSINTGRVFLNHEPSLEQTKKQELQLLSKEPLIEERLPCTPAQVDLIRRSQHLIKTTWKLDVAQEPVFGVDWIRWVWQALSSHHQVLRTVFKAAGGTYEQLVLRKTRAVQLWCQEEFETRESDLIGPAELVLRSCPQKQSLELHIHRALIDDHSLNLIEGDFRSFASGLAFERRRTFSDYVINSLSRGEAESQDFWKDNLSDLVESPIRFVSPRASDSGKFTTSCLSEQLDKNVWDRINALSSANDIPVSAVLYGAWALTVAWHSQLSNDTVLFAVSARDSSSFHTDSVVGHVEQTFPLKIFLDWDASPCAWLHTVANAFREASANSYIGYGRTSRYVPGGTTQSRIKVLDYEDTDSRIEDLDSFPLDLKVHTVNGIALNVHYSNSVKRQNAQALLGHFQTALTQLAAPSDAPLAALDLVSVKESTTLLEWGKPATEPAEGLVHRLFEAQVDKTPDADAVQFETDPPLTYNNLNKVANAVARQLTCGRGDFVPVCMRRSVNLIVALLAILKSGAAYVTLDPDVPVERNQFIVEDVRAPFVLTQRELMGKLRSEVFIEDFVYNAKHYDTSNLAGHQSSEDVVYVIYTSGSTGKPKGVLLEHKAAFSGLAAFPDISDLRQLFFHNPVFSAAQRSVWSTLKQGGCLCLASKENLTVFISDTINKMQINTIDVTPSTASLLTPGTVPSLLRMTVAGELINPSLVPKWINELELLNAYGLSENTQFNWRHVIEEGQNPQNIARPSDTTTAYVLVPGTVQLSPLMVPGELCLGGHQLARGYLNRPEKTTEAFISNPFGPGRLYRTGDMVVTHPDGSIEMIGRIDFQIKINDQRVEPGESNSIIQMHPDVYDSSVVAAFISGRKVMVAAVVLKPNIEWNSLMPKLRKSLQEKLSLYMIPAYWIQRDELPLNVNGKVDVPTLRKLVETLGRGGLLDQPANRETRSLEMTRDEAIVKDLCADILSIAPTEVAPSDSFMFLGGTSLDAIVFSSRARRMGLSITPPDVLLANSIMDIAKSTEKLINTTEESILPFSMVPSAINVDQNEFEDVFPATALQEGLIADTLLGRSDYFYTRAFRLKGPSVQALKEAFAEVVGSTPLLRSTFIPYKTSFLQGVHRRFEVPFDELALNLQQFLMSPHKEIAPSLDGPFLRAIILSDNTFVFQCHHALFDFWSSQFVIQDLSDRLQGRQPIARSNFRSFVHHLQRRDHVQSQRFWEDYLKGAAVPRFTSDVSHSFCLRRSLDFNLKEATSQQQLTIGSALYAAWAIALGRCRDQSDVVFAVTLSGRDAPIPNVLTMSGPTLTTVPLRVKLDQNDHPRQLAQNIQSGFWQMAEHSQFGMRNAVRTGALDASSIDTMVNFLITSKARDEDNFLKPIQLEDRQTTSYLTLEVDDRDLNSIYLMCSQQAPEAELLLDSTVNILEELLGNSNDLQALSDSTEKSTAISDPICTPDTSDADRHDTAAVTDVSPRQELFVNDVAAQDTLETLLSGDELEKALSGCESCVLARDSRKPSSDQHEVSFSISIRDHVESDRAISLKEIIIAAWSLVLSRQLSSDIINFAVRKGQDQSNSLLLSLKQFKIGLETTLDSLVTSGRRSSSEDLIMSWDTLKGFASDKRTFDTLINFGTKAVEGLSSFTCLTVAADENTMRCMLSSPLPQRETHFLTVEFTNAVEALIKEPNITFQAVDTVAKDEVHFLERLANYDRPTPQLLHERFESIVIARGDDVALEWETTERLTYNQLNSRAKRLASRLIGSGVQRGEYVPLLLPKCVDTIVSMLGVLKAGAAFVPLGPDHPPDRTLFVLEEVCARHMIVHSSTSESLQSFSGQRIVVDTENVSEASSEHDRETAPGDVAYIIYTSGSTGFPKGVKVTHESSSAAIGSMLTAEHRTAGNWRTLQFANYVFDAAIQDIFNTLSSGGTLCMASMEWMLSDLAGVINVMNVKQAILTPTVARFISPDDVPEFETMILGGEPMTADILEKWASKTTLLNVYGPTETSMVVSTKRVEKDTEPSNIGRPFGTVAAMIMETKSPEPRLAPYGAIGELCIAGPQVSRGYQARPDLTSQAFVPSPITGHGIMYRTGDLARWLDSGELECLGRKDNQVKVAGHRIELGEIDQAILRTGLVHDCLTMVLQISGQPNIATFAIFEESSEVLVLDPKDYSQRIQQIRDGLNTLPSYMIPKSLLPFGKFPKLPSQKVDRKRIKSMAEDLVSKDASKFSFGNLDTDQGSLEATSNINEHRLKHLWSEVFSIGEDSVGANSNFLSMGGDSIAAINLVSFCRRSGYGLSVNDVLRHPKLQDMATKLQSSSHVIQINPKKRFERSGMLTGRIAAAGVKEEDIECVYPCPPGQAEFLNHGSRDGQYWTLMTVRKLPFTTDTKKWIETVTELTKLNDSLRTTYEKVPDLGWIAVVLRDSTLELTQHWCCRKQRETIIEEVWNKRFEFGKPFVRYSILNYPDGMREVVVKIDHGVWDGTLMRIYDDHFQALQRHKPIKPPTEFREFASHHWESEKQTSLDFWKKQIDPSQTSFPPVHEPKINCAVITPVDERLEDIATSCEVTVPVIFQGAFQLWMSRTAGRKNISYDYLLTGRNVDLPDPQSINGNCANFLPFCFQVDNNVSIGSYMTHLQNYFWEATEHGNVGLDDIYQAAGADRSKSGNTCMFLFQPFEPAKGPAKEEMRWVVLALSEVRMYQPYGLVVEVSKSLTAYKLKVMFDDRIFSKEDGEQISQEIIEIVRGLKDASPHQLTGTI